MTPSDILRIARDVHPETDWSIGWPAAVFVVRGELERAFDPLNDSADAFAVLVWLLAQDTYNEVHDNHVLIWDMSVNHRFRINHDGTEAGLRRAIGEAAKRVVGEPK